MTTYTCPECGATMQRTGRGSTARKHGYHYVCPVSAAARGQRTSDDPHTYVRAWTIDELEPRARPLPMTGTDYHVFGEE